ncbi:MAG: DNA-binding response regulator [Pseudomonadota bacterium]
MTEETVFIVDDDRDMRTSLQWLLESINLKVELFESAEAFLSANRLDHPGCLILDVRMPGIGGLRLLEQLRSQGYRIPAIILTGHGEISMAVQSMKSGAFDFLEKPASPQVILDRVQDALRLDRETREKSKGSRVLEEQMNQLTRREREILELLVSGESTRGIAERLFISERTVEKHRENLLGKMEAHSMMELIRRILEHRGSV